MITSNLRAKTKSNSHMDLHEKKIQSIKPWEDRSNWGVPTWYEHSRSSGKYSKKLYSKQVRRAARIEIIEALTQVA